MEEIKNATTEVGFKNGNVEILIKSDTDEPDVRIILSYESAIEFAVTIIENAGYVRLAPKLGPHITLHASPFEKE